MALMPVLFIGHGTPMNALELNRFSRDWLDLNKDTSKPKAIVSISAHWLTKGTHVTANEKPPTIHDFHGFPKPLFNTDYPCPGAPELAQKITESVTATAIQKDHSWGLDHGSWSVLKHLYPDANIPVIQLSIDINQAPSFHYELAKQLRFLREQQVLIIGSGNIVHNIHKWISNPNGPIDWAKNFNKKVITAINDHDHQALINYQRWQPEAEDAVPTAEHYLPLIYILGLRDKHDQFRHSAFEQDSIENCSMTSLVFHPTPH